VWDTSFNVSAAFEVNAANENVDSLETIPVPEPGQIGSLLCGLTLLGALGRRRPLTCGQSR
jgi:hypothetical protein